MNESYRSYRASSTYGATELDLILAVYDALARDFNRIGEAIAAADIEARCKASNHALLLLGYLDTWLERSQEPQLVQSLKTFYSYLRTEVMRLSLSQNGSSPQDIAMMICETRVAWQQKRSLTQAASVERTASSGHEIHAATDVCPRLGWSA